MKVISRFIIFTIILGIIRGRNIEEPGFPQEIVDFLRNIREKCKAETGASMESILSTDYGGFASDDAFKCYLKCTMIEMKTMDENGFIDVQKVNEAFPQPFKDYGIPKLVSTCGNKEGKDICEKAFNTLRCFYDLSPETFLTI